MARKPDMVVWRSTYFCNGSCSLTPPDRQAHEATVEEELKNRAEIIRHQLQSDELPESPPSRSTGPKNRRTCPYAAQLVLEMTERQAVNGTCTVRWMKSECHPRPQDLSVLRMAPFIRSWLHEAALLFAMTPKRLEIHFRDTMLARNPQMQIFQADHQHRMPTEQDYRTAVVTVAKQNRYSAHELSAVLVVARKKHEAIISFHSDLPDDVKAPILSFEESCRLECVISPPFGLETAIRHSMERGLYMDSSWRNKNAQKCPVTIVATINQYHRMIPIAVMISRNADTQAYQYLLSSLRQSVIAHAGRLVSGEVKPRYVDPNDVDALLRHATGIVNEEDFAPLFTMIDGDDAEREGIEQTWPGLPIRA
ncbi:hypothetical protein JCM24511_10246, partial [Saitozyma sp. JCM 24511]